MPAVLRADGFVFTIYPDDHPPPHVHTWRSGVKVKIVIPPADPMIDLKQLRRLSPRDARTAIRLVTQHSAYLLACWEELHGTPRTD